MVTSQYSEGSLFRRSIIPKVHWSEGALVRKLVDIVLYHWEYHKFYSQSCYIIASRGWHACGMCVAYLYFFSLRLSYDAASIKGSIIYQHSIVAAP